MKPVLLVVARILLAGLTILCVCLAATASDPQTRARAALALSLSQPSHCGCTNPAECSCVAGCDCANCKAHPTTCGATDGGPDWTWDVARGDWFRVLPLAPPATPVPAPPPVFYYHTPPPGPGVGQLPGVPPGGGFSFRGGRRGGC